MTTPMRMLNADRDASVRPLVAAGVVGAVVAPLFFYPWSKTLWVAIELIMRPRHASEPSDA